MKSFENPLDCPERYGSIQGIIDKKALLNLWYRAIYGRFKDELNTVPATGVVLELGSGAGFIKNLIPETITSDIIPYPGVDRVVDATRMPFENNSVRLIFMVNVLHHIPDVEAFFREADRCLMSGGKIFIVDQFPGFFSRWIFTWAHHEPFRMNAENWTFPSTGPLSGANGALAHIVFFRDYILFQRKFPGLKTVRKTPHSPFTYWVAGGLKRGALIPKFLANPFFRFDEWLGQVLPSMCSFVDIVIQKT